jgi:uptake hydrogenase large subunit
VTIEGELTVRLDWDGRRVRKASIRSTRPFAAARVLVDRSPAEAVRTVPLLFSICAHAQGAAAAGAVEAAAGRTACDTTLAAREAAVWLETIQEYLWRILVDWPRAMGQDAQIEPVAVARRLIAPVLAHLAPLARRTDDMAGDGAAGVPVELAEELARLVARHVFGVAPAAWLALPDSGALAAWATQASTLPALLLRQLRSTHPALGRSGIALMRTPRQDELCTTVVPAMRHCAGFERAPVWSGAAMETGALARMQAHPLVAAELSLHGNAAATRMVARLAELALLVGRLAEPAANRDGVRWVGALPLDECEGLGVVQTARGLLLHRAQVGDSRVTVYQIVAPTEWNFHPEGALVRGLEGLEAADEAELARATQLAVQALDPCVACRVEVAHA